MATNMAKKITAVTKVGMKVAKIDASEVDPSLLCPPEPGSCGCSK